jgi:3-isopropylmalate dehydratase small subunit
MVKMSKTIIQKIFENHSESKANVGNIIDVEIDVRAARDFGGANVVENLEKHNLRIDDPKKTVFAFDCNPGGCDQKYAANQHICRLFARKNKIKIFDVDKGIGTHLAIEEGLISPGGTFVSTDSHANIVGAIGAFGQGMGDVDIASVFSHGKIWFKVPPSIKIIIKGKPSILATPKDIVLKMVQVLGANGLLGYAAEIYGEYIDNLSLDGRITIASMATEMGGFIILFPPNKAVEDFYRLNFGKEIKSISADKDAKYEKIIEIDIEGLKPQIARPGHPEDVVDVKDLYKTPVDSGFIGSCTNGRLEDLKAAANILKGRKIAPGRVLKIVPSTDRIWKMCLKEGLISIFKEAGALIGSAGCAGCAAGQIGQTGDEEVSVSSGNRNFLGKQGKGNIFLASPSTVSASLIAGYITTEDSIPEKSETIKIPVRKTQTIHKKKKIVESPLKKSGVAWVIKKDNIDTDMIFHNRYLTISNVDEMGQYTFDNLQGYEKFSQQLKKGDIVVVGKNFGCGSSRQQAVDCFKSLGIGVILAESFGAIYERNAINNAMPIITAEDITKKIHDKDQIMVDFVNGQIINKTQKTTIYAKPFSKVQLEIYKRGGLLEG